GGVILNRVASDRHEELLREALGDIGVPVLGMLRRRALAPGGATALPDRALGPVPVIHRSLEATRAVRRLGETVAATVDVERILRLARSAPDLPQEPWSAAAETGAGAASDGPRPVIAIAGGYGYPEIGELAYAAGAEVVAVDPLRDEALPEGTAGLVIPGGLPEAYADELAANGGLSASVAQLARSGRPVIAEGAGLVWLCREFDGQPMCGVLDAAARTADQLVIGYRAATAQAASPIGPAGTQVVGYKQHRTQVSPRAGTDAAWLWPGGRPEGFVRRGVHASYLTLHWAGHPEIANRLVAAATADASAEREEAA
ncbi:MAG TPA: cobyrinic acid a,c-diamide synthase, partial [Micromonosporaceae bacterium]|nr:cobyrinic acid a,c-diamide synthase [Micromonosporaceae bacterium]